MKRSLIVFFTMSFFCSYSQDENLTHSLGKKQPAKPSATTMLAMGVETGSIASINTETNDSSHSSVYTGVYFNYQHKSNFGLEVNSYALIAGSNPGFYLTCISPYYSNYSGKFVPYISYTRYIDHSNPAVPYSPIQNDIYARLKIKTKIVDPVLAIDLGFGRDAQDNNRPVNDFNSFAGISRLIVPGFLNKKDEVFAIVPFARLNAGTDRYFKFLSTTKYISQNRSPQQIGFRRGRRSNSDPVATTGEQLMISEANKFALSNAEINLSLIYLVGNFSIEPSGSLYFPFRTDNKNVYGYWQLNLNYWIR